MRDETRKNGELGVRQTVPMDTMYRHVSFIPCISECKLDPFCIILVYVLCTPFCKNWVCGCSFSNVNRQVNCGSLWYRIWIDSGILPLHLRQWHFLLCRFTDRPCSVNYFGIFCELWIERYHSKHYLLPVSLCYCVFGTFFVFWFVDHVSPWFFTHFFSFSDSFAIRLFLTMTVSDIIIILVIIMIVFIVSMIVMIFLFHHWIADDNSSAFLEVGDYFLVLFQRSLFLAPTVVKDIPRMIQESFPVLR